MYNSKDDNWEHWLIMGKDSIFTLGVFHGKHGDAEQYAKNIYKSDFKVIKDNRNDNHPFWHNYHIKASKI
jgi:hypothetical protein